MNIFARELTEVLATHDKELSSLYTLKSPTQVIHPGKVSRLKRSLRDGTSASLNAEELELVRNTVRLSDEEMYRLRAALVAETVRYMLEGRMMIVHAAQVAELTFQLLVTPEGMQMKALRDRVLDQIRGSATDTDATAITPVTDDSVTDDPVEQALEAATQEYEASTLWLELARDTPQRSARRGYLGQASTLLLHARTLAEHPATLALNTPAQRALLDLISAALAKIEQLR
jgi:hypothetical protein